MESGSLHCPACDAAVVSDAVACWACGSPLAVKACPACSGALAPGSAGEVPAMACGDCRGVWVARAVFETVAARPVPASGLGPVCGRRCPDCGERMRHLRCGQADGVLAEVCREHGLWFDADELGRVLASLRRGGPRAAEAKVPLPAAPALQAPAGSGFDASDALEVVEGVVTVLGWIAELLPDE